MADLSSKSSALPDSGLIKCPFCEAKFHRNNIRDISVHTDNNHKNILLNCFLCDFQSSRMAKWIRHLTKKHFHETSLLANLASTVRSKLENTGSFVCMNQRDKQIPSIAKVPFSTNVPNATELKTETSLVSLPESLTQKTRKRKLKNAGTDNDITTFSDIGPSEDIKSDSDSECVDSNTGTVPRYPCNHCDRGFQTSNGLKRHKMLAHSGETTHKKNAMLAHPGESTQDQCPPSPKQRKKDLSCSLCSEAFRTQESLECHLSLHCDICPFVGQSRSLLIRHQRIHSGEKPFQCPHCDFRAAVKSSITMHLLTHTGERPYPCRLCDYSARTASQRIAHERTHSGVKPYTCPWCSRSFTQAAGRNRHMRMEVCVDVAL